MGTSVSDEVRYVDIGPEERALDWRITTRILSDKVLMKTLEESQSGGEKHAVVAVVQGGELQEAYVSPEAAVKKAYPFNAVDQAFAAYKVGRGVCLLLVRDRKAVISINGVR
jgi:IS4 transposase